MYDIIIIGAGPAGLTAAIYARRAEKKTLVLESKGYGGQIIKTPEIENYPAEPNISGFDFATRLFEQAKNLGTEFIFEKALGIEDCGPVKKVSAPSGIYESACVIIATGCESRKLGVDGEDSLVGRGISYCATCDGNFFKNKTVAVVGGGNTALEDALYLSDIAEKVYLIHRRDKFRGDETAVSRVRERENIDIIYNSTVTKINAEKRLKSIEITDKSGNVAELEVKGLFVAVGRIPENGEFSDIIELDQSGYAVAGENCLTSVPGIFVAGDNRTKDVRQLVTAAADGAVAATEAIRYIAKMKTGK